MQTNILEPGQVYRVGCRCERCGYEWSPRGEHTPTTCPHCKSAYWNRPKRQKADFSWEVDEEEEIDKQKIAESQRRILDAIIQEIKEGAS